MTINESFQSEWADIPASGSRPQHDEQYVHYDSTDIDGATRHNASNDDEYKSKQSTYKSLELPLVENYLQSEPSSIDSVLYESMSPKLESSESLDTSSVDTSSYKKTSSDNKIASTEYLLDEHNLATNDKTYDTSVQKLTPHVSERIFMNGLIKHTAIALVIIIPLAAMSAYAAPVTTMDKKAQPAPAPSVLPVAPSDIIYKSTTTPTTVDKVDLEKYSGKWYEIGRMPLFFQRNCARDVTATYASQADSSDIRVINECIAADGEMIRSEGLAMPVDATGSKLKVTFLPSWIRWLPVGRGDYWVLARDDKYQTALVGTPDKSNLWLLARTPDVSQQTYSKYRQIAQQQGYDLKEFTLTPQTNQSVNLVP